MMTEYLHEVRPVKIVELAPGEYTDNRPFIEDLTDYLYSDQHIMVPPYPLTEFNTIDVKLSNGDIYYKARAGSCMWRDDGSNPFVIAYRQSDTSKEDDILRQKIKEYHGKDL